MPISFDNIPANLRTPGSYIEFNNELAGANGQEFKLLILGQRLASGTVAAGVPKLVTRASDADAYYGRGSMLAEMIRASLNASKDVELVAIALADNGAGVAATKTVTVTGSPTEAGTVNLYVGGKRAQSAVTSGQTVTQVAAAIAAAVNADTSMEMTAGAAVGVVTLTARHAGECGNGIDVRVGYYDEKLPAGIAIAVADGVTGATNPDLAAAITAMGDTWYNWIACPYTDAANMTLLEAELNRRWGPTVQTGARAFAAFRGTLANTQTFGNGRNNPHVTCMGMSVSPQPPYIWAAVNATIAAKSLSIDPARPVQRLALTGIMAPALTARFTREERNVLLYDGIATHTVDTDGTVRIERQVTMYQTNSGGIADASYLDIETPETLERIRYRQRARILQKYPRHKLAADGTQYGAGQAIVTPSIIKGELLALYREMEADGWVEGFDHYKETLIVEIDAADHNRVNVNDQPNLVNQFRVHAQKTQFII